MVGEEVVAGEARLAAVYLAIIERYRDYIEEKENISVAELPRLVTPGEGVVRRKVEEIKGSLAPYYFNTRFEGAAEAAFLFVKETVKDVVLPVQFWLMPKETITYSAGDEVDKCILLCSLLIALGNPSTKVLMRVKDDIRKVFVYCSYNDRLMFFDFAEGKRTFKDEKEMLDAIGFGGGTYAYEFNDRTYRDIV